MTLSHHPGFTLVGDVITREVLPRLRYAQKLPLRLSCMGTAGYEGLDEADEFDRTVVIGQSASAEERDRRQFGDPVGQDPRPVLRVNPLHVMDGREGPQDHSIVYHQ